MAAAAAAGGAEAQYAAGDRVLALWDGAWYRGRVVSAPLAVPSGFRYEVCLDEGGASTIDADNPDGGTSGHHETELRPAESEDEEDEEEGEGSNDDHSAGEDAPSPPPGHGVFPFELLPDSVLLLIFGFFTTHELCCVSKTCRRFYHVAFDPSLWRVVNLGGRSNEKVTDEVAVRLLSLSAGVVSVNLPCRKITDTALAAVGKCHQLGALKLYRCPRVTDAGLQSAAVGCPGLRSLELLGMRGITDAGVGAFAAACPQLARLSLSACREVTDGALLAVAQHLNLRELDVSRCNVTDTGLARIALACSRLSRLSVRLTGVTDVGLALVARHLPGLRYLDFGWCEGVTDATLLELAAHTQGLEVLLALEAPRISDVGAIPLVRRSPGLIKLNFTDCSITAATVLAVAENCPALSHFEVCTSSQTNDLEPISVAAYLALLDGCPALRVLGVMGNKLFTKAVVKRIGRLRPDLELLVSPRLLATRR